MRWRLALMLAAAVGVSLAPIRSDAQNQNASLMRQLESTDWRRRAVAFTDIDRDPRAWEQPRSAHSLLNLVAREGALQKETLLSSNGAVGVSDRFGEEYSEYAARALDECLRYCDRDKLLTMIVNDAQSGPTEAARDSSGPVRESAVRRLGELEKLPDRSSSPESKSASPRQLVEFRLVRDSPVTERDLNPRMSARQE
jgi:hypothetical protein